MLKKTILSIFLSLLLSTGLIAQDIIQGNKDVLNDTIVMNSPPFKLWKKVYSDAKNDIGFQKQISNNLKYKNLLDSTEKYYNILNNRRLYSALDVAIGDGAIVFFINNPQICLVAIPYYLISGYIFYKVNTNYLDEKKFYLNCIQLMNSVDYNLNKYNWEVKNIDRKRYLEFKKHFTNQ